MTLGTTVTADVPLTGDLGKGLRNASLILKAGKIILSDSVTKYGAYLKIERPIMIKNNVPRHFLYKNKIMSLKVE